MMNDDEWQLVQAFARDRSEAAFAELVRRYVRLVYGRCLRQLGDAHAAEDVTQGVFLVMADRAASLTPDLTLGAWLYKVAGLACRNEVRMRLRRRRHEAAAAAEQARVSQADGDAAVDLAALAPLLDAAVDRLGEADRRAVLLRYFDGRPVRDVAAALGVSENTAGRRLLRAIGKLRATFAGHGVAMSAAAVGPAVAAVVAATAAPPARAAAAAEPAGRAVARAAGRSLRWSPWKPVAAAAAVVAAGVGGWAVTRPAPAPTVAVPVPTVPVAAAAAVVADPPAPDYIDPAEARVPGEPRLAQWNLLLTEDGYAAVRDVGVTLETASRVYAGKVCNAATLRRQVAAAADAGGVAAVSHASGLLPISAAAPDGPRSRPAQLMALYSSDTPAGFVAVQGLSQRYDDTFEMAASDPGQVDVHVNHPDLNTGLADRPGQNPRRPRGGCGIVFKARISAGQTVAFAARLVAPSGRVYYHLMAWEMFAATDAQAAVVQFPLDAVYWCRTGPDRLRLWADDERVWSAGVGGGRPLGPPSLGRKLSTGEDVWLYALSRPAAHPYCWWDPAGKPAAASTAVPVDGPPPDGLWAEVGVAPPLAPPGHGTSPFGGGRGGGGAAGPGVDDEANGERADPFPTTNDCQKLDGAATDLHVGVPVGPWAEVVRLKYGEPATAGGVEYSVVPDKDNPRFWGTLTRRGVLDDQMHVVAVHRDGTRHKFDVGRTLAWGEPGVRRDLTEQVYADGSAEQVDYFSVRLRKREFVTFAGFAKTPATPPPDLTRPQADAAVGRITDAHLQRGLDLLRQRRPAYALFGPAKADDWNAGTPMLLHAAAALDEAAVRRAISADDPKVADAVAGLIVRGERVRAAVERRFGEAVAHDLLDRPGLFADVQAELLETGWAGTVGSRYHVHRYTDVASGDAWLGTVVWRQGPAGEYTLDVTGLSRTPAAMDALAARRERADAVLNRLAATDPAATVDEVRRAVDGGP